jgi:hypothetical protein
MSVVRRGHGDSLGALLDEQRAALRTGRLEDLVGLLPRLERAVAALGPGLGAEELARLRGAAAANAALLVAARDGLARARALREGAGAAVLATYDAAGRKAPSASAGRTLARR